jgi:thiol:disulfide interchange protein
MKTLLQSLFALALTAALALPICAEPKHIYPAPEQAPADISAALLKARNTHRRILLDFGGDWCGDCQLLDIYLHQPENLKLLDAHFLLVHINIGHTDKNLELAEQYGIPLKKGVPALAVLDSRGRLLYSQRNGEFEAMRSMDPTSVRQFLVTWGTPRGDCSAVYINC